jgi:hypothetical protein
MEAGCFDNKKQLIMPAVEYKYGSDTAFPFWKIVLVSLIASS